MSSPSTPALSAAPEEKKPHPFQTHPACGRLRHRFSRTAPRAGATARQIDPKIDKCALCGQDEAAHALKPSDYIGELGQLEAFLEAANPETIDVEAPIATVAGELIGGPSGELLEVARLVDEVRNEVAGAVRTVVDDRIGELEEELDAKQRTIDQLVERISKLEEQAKHKAKDKDK